MKRVRGSVTTAAIAVAALAIWPAASQATTFCVPGFHAACKNNGKNVARKSLDKAMSSQASDGKADTVLIAAGTLTDPNGFRVASGSDKLLVRGAGRTKTKLTTSSTLSTIVVDLWSGGANSRKITMRDLTIVVPASAPDSGGSAVQPAGDSLVNVNLRVLNDHGSAAYSWPGGGTFRGGTITTGGDGVIQFGVNAYPSTGGVITIEDATIRNAVSAVSNSDPATTMVVRRSRIFNSEQVAVSGSAGTTTVANTLIAGPGYGSQVVAFVNSAASVDITVDHVTFQGDNTSATHPLTSQVNDEGNASVVVKNSIAVDYPYTYLCSAPTSAILGNASIEVSYSNMDLSGPEASESGDCTSTTSVGNIDLDPLLRDSLRLAPGSPSIDAGDPGLTGGLDLDRLPRVTDGDGNGEAFTDQGAFEFDRKAPRTKITSGPGGGIDEGVAKFAFKSNEKRVTFMCRVDKRKYRRCRNPKSFSGLDPGEHDFEVYAVDLYGNRDKSPAGKGFHVPG